MNNKQMLKTVGNVSLYNSQHGSALPVPDEIKILNKRVGWNDMDGSTNSSVFHAMLEEDLYGQELLDEIAYYQNKATRDSYESFSLDAEDILAETKFFNRNMTIAKEKIASGFKAGLIDFGLTALVKTEDGWKNENGDIVANNEATLIELSKLKPSNVKLVTSIDSKLLEQFEEQGSIFINGRQIARKQEDGSWKDFRGKTFASGESLRVLAHSDEEFMVFGSSVDEMVFHGSVTSDSAPSSKNRIRDGVSIQGSAVYGTTDINEAVKIYGNPRSFEIGGKLLDMHERGEVDKSRYIMSHLYKLECEGRVFKASIGDSGYFGQESIPSLPAVLAIAKETGVNETYATNCWLRMKNCDSAYETYSMIDALQKASIRSGGTGDVLPKLFSSMGFNQIEIEFPSAETLSEIQKKIDSLENLDQSFFKDAGVAKKPMMSVLKSCYSSIEQSIPAKAKCKHVLYFDRSKVEKTHLKHMPISQGLDGDIYDPDREITLDDVMSSKSPDFDDMKQYWQCHEDKEMSI